MEAFTPDDLSRPDRKLRDPELTTLIVQPAFVEGIVPEERTFETIPEAFRFIFRNNREYGIVLWNGLPVRFSYTEDLPLMIEPLTALWTGLLADEWQTLDCTLETPAFHLSWEVERGEGDAIVIRQYCSRIDGNYRENLEELSIISLSCNTFLREWKLVIAQLCEACRRSGITVTSPEARETLRKLDLLNESITGRGVLYDY